MRGLSKPKEKLPNYKVRGAILLLVSQLPLLIVFLFENVDSSIVRQSAQTLIPVAGFLASATIAMTFFYSGKLLDFVSPATPLVENLRQPIRAFVMDSLKKAFERVFGLEDPKFIVEAFKDPKLIVEVLERTFKPLIDMTELGVKSVMTSPREITRNGSVSFALLVTSAVFSVLTMLGGEIILLGESLTLLILGAGSLIISWSQAQDRLHAYLMGAYLLKVVGLGLDLDKSPQEA